MYGFLAVPSPGERTLGVLRHKVRLLAVRRLVASVDEPLRSVLVRLLKEDPKRLLDVVGRPDVLTAMLCLEASLKPVPEMLGIAVPSLLAGLGSLPEAVIWDGPVDRIVDPVHGRAFDVEVTAILADPAGVEVQLVDGRRLPLSDVDATEPFSTLRGPVRFSMVDTNPLAMLEEHPDKFGNALSLGGHDESAWRKTLEEALDLIREVMPTWADELAFSLQRLVPVGFHAERHLSASYREAPGMAYLTLHPDLVTMAEAIVHETQHGKINLLSWLDPVMTNAFTAWTESPVRPDLRPLWGVLLAVHAFVPVALLHERLAAAKHPLTEPRRFQVRRAQVLAGNRHGLNILAEKGEWTKTGKRCFDALMDMQTALEAVAPEPPEPIPEDVLPPS